jgi:hypothetical protein
VRTRWVFPALLLGSCVVLAGCGSGDEDTVRSSAQRFLDLASAHDPAACDLLAPLARESLNREGAEKCSSAGLGRGAVLTVAVWGDEAQAKDQAAMTMFLHDFAAGWRVTGAGCTPRNEQLYQCAVGGP